MMQDLVGIVRSEDEMQKALEGIEALKARAAKVGVAGNREYNPGWHTALDLRNLLTCRRGDRARRRSSARRAAAATSARTSRTRIRTSATFNHRGAQGAGRRDASCGASRSRRCATS